MFRPSRILLAVSVVSFPVLAASAAQTHMPTPSTWSLNLAESNFGGGVGMKSDVFVMLADNAKWAKFTDTMVDDQGKTWHMRWSGPADGTAHPMVGMPGATFADDAAKDTDTQVFSDGTTSVCKFWLSADKKKFSEKCDVSTKSGKRFVQHIVYDRIK